MLQLSIYHKEKSIKNNQIHIDHVDNQLTFSDGYLYAPTKTIPSDSIRDVNFRWLSKDTYTLHLYLPSGVYTFLTRQNPRSFIRELKEATHLS
ncbi:hypothetical protein DES38_102242 [Streptohalobacillus salinus]|uniref:Uncharacterized protein n=1 Tax=Streptohalobacillus salinus TaxID=621096 RepID=A0A2V3WJD5_9BACI|nr:hypothetical protein [Streptohalobacillus salinus]PXW92658.1 hypothetical protein DES38_102242 [Streptohalobacillus salinus]